MLYDLTAVKANIRNREGKRIFFLGKGDQLTSEARDHLTRERIQIRPAETAKIDTYRLLNGAALQEKPEHMTHLHGDILVPKTHPRIAFRGAMDTLEAELLLCQQAAPNLQRDLQEILELARNLIRWEVMDEPVEQGKLCGLTEDQLRQHSHYPQAHYGQPHFMPAVTDGPVILQLNRARCAARHAELMAVRAFTDENGNPTREDLLRALNRMSSMLYILMIRQKAGKKEETPWN